MAGKFQDWFPTTSCFVNHNVEISNLIIIIFAIIITVNITIIITSIAIILELLCRRQGYDLESVVSHNLGTLDLLTVFKTVRCSQAIPKITGFYIVSTEMPMLSIVM